MILRPFLRIAFICVTLAACSQSEESAPDASPQITPDASNTQVLPALTVVQRYDDLGGKITALTALPQPQPWRSRILAALDNGGLALINLALGDVTVLNSPTGAAGLVTAPDFQLRGTPAPLVVAGGGALGAPAVFIYIEAPSDDPLDPGAPPLLAPMPAAPIAPELTVIDICPVRATPALVEVLVIAESTAEIWRLQDTGNSLLDAERVDTLPLAAAAADCAAGPGREPLVLDRDGALASGPVRGLAVTGLALDDRHVALVARDIGDFAVANAGDGAFLFEIDDDDPRAINTNPLDRASVMTASSANFGGSYNDGVIVMAHEDDIAILSLVQTQAALNAALALRESDR